MKVFLTGGTGYLGGRVARRLLASGHEVTALVRDPDRAAALVGCGAALVTGELGSPGVWEREVRSTDAVVHVAAHVRSWGDSRVFERINVSAALELIDAAREAGVERILATGSLFSLGPAAAGEVRDERALAAPAHPVSSANDYVRTKTAFAKAILDRRADGDPTVLLFPTILIGPGALTAGNHTAQVLSDIGRGRLPGLVGSGDQLWNLVGVEDVAEGYRAALEQAPQGEAYILGGENWTQRRLVEEAARVFDVKAPLRALGTRLPLILGRLSELWAGVSRRDPMLTTGEVRLYDQNWAFTSDKAREAFGYRPKPVSETLVDTVTWLKEEIWKRS